MGIKGVERRPFHVHRDSRGSLFEALRSDERIFEGFGQAYVVSCYAGETRGGHLHQATFDYFVLLKGVCTFCMVDLRPGNTIGDSIRIPMDSDAEEPFGLLVPPGIWHRIDAHREHGFIGLGLPSLPYNADRPDTVAMTYEEALRRAGENTVEDHLLDEKKPRRGARFGRLAGRRLGG